MYALYSQTAVEPLLVPPLPKYAALEKLLNLAVSQFLNWEIVIKNTATSGDGYNIK